jgi:hypothetical protein
VSLSSDGHHLSVSGDALHSRVVFEAEARGELRDENDPFDLEVDADEFDVSLC